MVPPGLLIPAYVFSGCSEISSRGFPHSEILGAKPLLLPDAYRIFARPFLRLLAPRHPPYALSSYHKTYSRRPLLVS